MMFFFFFIFALSLSLSLLSPRVTITRVKLALSRSLNGVTSISKEAVLQPVSLITKKGRQVLDNIHTWAFLLYKKQD